jgi:hypothetical protein
VFKRHLSLRKVRKLFKKTVPVGVIDALYDTIITVLLGLLVLRETSVYEQAIAVVEKAIQELIDLAAAENEANQMQVEVNRLMTPPPSWN